MPLYQVAPTRQLPHTIDLIQRQSAPRFANEVERDQQYPDPELGALSVVNTTVEVFNGTGWIPVGGGQPTRINNLQDVDARFPPDGAVLTWSSAAQAWGWSMPATTCITFTDDFERADGPIGADWMLGLETTTGEAPELPTISSGAAIGPGDPGGSPDPVATMSWATEIVADNQFIEIVFDNWHNTADASAYMHIEMYCFGGGGDVAGHSEARRAAGFQQTISAGEVRVGVDAYTYLDDGSTTDGEFQAWQPYTGSTGAQTLRLDSYAGGRQVVTLNGTVIHDYIETDAPFTYLGYQQGVWMSWRVATGRTSPRILSITGGCLEST